MLRERSLTMQCWAAHLALYRVTISETTISCHSDWRLRQHCPTAALAERPVVCPASLAGPACEAAAGPARQALSSLSLLGLRSACLQPFCLVQRRVAASSLGGGVFCITFDLGDRLYIYTILSPPWNIQLLQ